MRKIVTSLLFLLLALIGWGMFEIFKKILAFISNASSEVAVGIIAASASIFISVLTVIITKHFERRHEIIREHRTMKIPVYQKQIGFFFRILLGEKAGEVKATEKEIISFMKDATQEIIA